ncbi:ABC transporter permease [Paraburkholderia hospita]|jgi:putative xylitol transport system permease protein|uniref:ABC transporter permease n=2 Tax=Paraburkholderia hospita TaxID=169430 RepID=UPI0002715891|nr:ABC transporter permease [Paraburkholderia hospita]EUC20978.1 ABC-type transporter, integral membrane subunit [Burkholderia sp. BT03]SOE87525.1 monosaccharide ABC transporter membrane protein, CUT2 family [Burkholderia sp. YR290]AXF04746.1 ABC transporter permease [Paraburkholderia hospita]SKC57232.1 monosaccharide ABC transporter membrane protein, CUT2 family [Paraburkholderia hospita]SKD06162.1 monosaccharide ABC transporter membrane protein, CUT2 family [Paraburkholderia hospita]
MNTHIPSLKAPANQSRSAQMRDIYRRYGIVAVLIVLCIVLSFANQYFLTLGNIADILRQTSINGILAVGMTYVVLTAGIDLSVGSTLALAGIISASLVTGAHPHGAAFGLVAGLAVGAAIGAINGLLVARLSIPPFVATLGMLSAARGLTYIYNDGMPVTDLPDGYLTIGTGAIAGIPVPIIVFALVVVLFWFVLRYTTYGRYVYAVGGNVKSAKTSGISTGKIIFSVYVIGGLLAGLAGIILAARTTSALPQAGMSYELDAIAAVVIGGTSLSGGTGSLGGTVVGALLIGVINNGLNLLGVSSYYQQVVKGVIIVGAVLLDASRKKQ